MTSFDEMMSNLDPKVAKQVMLASQIELEQIPLASIGLTNALSGGIGKGRLTLVYGSYAGTKSALMLESVGMWQKMGLSCVWVDAEKAFSREWATSLGVDVNAMPVFQSRHPEKIEQWLKPFLAGGVDVVIIDSISAILPSAFLLEDGDLKGERKQIGAHAKTIKNLLDGIQYANEDAAIVVISQTSTDLSGNGQHKPQRPNGGKKVLFDSSQIIKLTSSASEGQQIKGEMIQGDMVVQTSIGRTVEYMVEKNRMGRPFIAGTYNFYYGGENIGIDKIEEVLSAAIAYGIVEQKKTWFTCTLTGTQYQGKNNLVKALRADEKHWNLMVEAVDRVLSDREPVAGVDLEDDEL